MITNKTVVISCAGMGKRLGIGTTKALVNVCGKPLIIRTLELLKDVKDVRVVVGYQAEKVISVVKEFRKDVIFVFNNDYAHNGTAASVCRALPGAAEYILTIDGDLIVHPDDMKTLLALDYECVCGTKIDSDDAVLLSVNTNGEVTGFSREQGDFEWTGVCHLKTANIIPSEKHVYQMIEPVLPKKHLFIRTKEIDTLDDFVRAEKWIENGFEDKVVVGVLGGAGSYATLELFDMFLKKFPAEKEWERPRIVIDNNCTMPSRVRAILYNEKTNLLLNEMNKSLSDLVSAGATDIVIGCNTAHVFLNKIYEMNPKLKRYIHNIITLTAEKCKEENMKSIYLLASEGTILSDIFGKTFKEFGIEIEYSKNDFETIRGFIECVKQNTINQNDVSKFANFVNGLKFDNIVLGCIELPILANRAGEMIKKNTINPLEIALDDIKLKFDKIYK